jgi:hypothetical protein
LKGRGFSPAAERNNKKRVRASVRTLDYFSVAIFFSLFMDLFLGIPILGMPFASRASIYLTLHYPEVTVDSTETIALLFSSVFAALPPKKIKILVKLTEVLKSRLYGSPVSAIRSVLEGI